MRRIGLLALMLLLAACRGTQPYSSQDLQQVKQAWTQIQPIMIAFEQAYKTGNAAAMASSFRQNEQTCKIEDAVDKRDTIDPNVQLFYASITVDDVCNNVESVYVLWRQEHHLPYDHTITPSRPGAEFIGLDKELKKMKYELNHPGALA